MFLGREGRRGVSGVLQVTRALSDVKFSSRVHSGAFKGQMKPQNM